MTEQQISEHLNRLSVFGAFKQEWLPEYCTVLKDKNYTFFVRAVDYLLAHYSGARFPRPAEIRKTIAEVASNSGSQDFTRDDVTYRDAEITGAWMAVFRRIPLIGNSAKRQEWLDKLSYYSPEWQDNPANKRELIAYFEGLLIQLKALLGERETEEKEMTPISEVPF